MKLPHSHSTATLSAALLTTWAALGQAQQAPGTNVPTPAPIPPGEPVVSVAVAPVLQEPVIDPKTYQRDIPNKPLLVTSVIVLGGTYGASAIAAAASDRESENKLYYPVAGPWLALDERECTIAEPCENKDWNTALLIGSGVLQGIGALGLLMSFVIPEKTQHSMYLVGDEHRENLLVVPQVANDQVGAVAVGRF